MKLVSMKHSDAEALFKALVAKYGTRWGPMIPPEAHAQLARCSQVLSAADKARLLGDLAKGVNNG